MQQNVFNCRYLHQIIELYSFLVVWQLCSVFYSDAMCSLAIDTNQLLVNPYRFHCYRLQNLFDDALYEQIEFDFCETHKCKYDEPVNITK